MFSINTVEGCLGDLFQMKLAMRGRHTAQTTLLTLLDIESRIPKDHPIRKVLRGMEWVLSWLER